MPTSTRQATPGPSTHSLAPITPIKTMKRALSEDTSEAETPDAVKRFKSESPTKSNKDRKKRRKKKKKVSIVSSDAIRSRSKPVSATSTRSTSAKPTSAQVSVDTVDGVKQEVKLEATVKEEIKLESIPSLLPTSSTNHTSLSPPSTKMETMQEDADTTIDKLQENIQAKTTLIQNHEKVLSQVQQSVTCQICLDLLYKPYALAPCGHVACHSCLVSWFTTPSPQEGQPPIQQSHYFYHRKKTCPHCRAVVRDRPIEVWTIKSMVSNLSQSGLLVGIPDPPPPENQTAAKEDPWKTIFMPVDGSFPDEEFGLHDDEDGVYRCLNCNHEIWRGECTHCGRTYPGHLLEDDDDDDWALEERLDELRSAEDMAFVITALAQVQHQMTLDRALQEEEEEEEEDYEPSFIDDDERAELSDSVMSHSGVAERYAMEPTEVVEITDDEDEDDDVSRHVRGVRRRRAMEILSDDEDPDEEEDLRTAARRLGRGTRFNSGGGRRFIECEEHALDDNLGYGSGADSHSEDGYNNHDDDEEDDDEIGMGHRTWLDYDGSSRSNSREGFILDDEDDGYIDHYGSMSGAYSDEDY